MAAMGACGIGFKRLYRPLLMVTLPITLLMLVLTLYVMPPIARQGQLVKAGVQARSELSGLVAGRFNESKDGSSIMFMERQSNDGRFMENIFLHRDEQDTTSIETASRARHYQDKEGRSFMLFSNGQYYQGTPGQSDYRITRYETHAIHIPENELGNAITRNDELSTAELWGSDNPNHRGELQWRLSIPLATLLLAVLALPLSYTTPRKGRYSKLALAILIYLMYSNLLGVGQTWVERQMVPSWLGIWWVHGFVLVLILFWWLRRSGGLFEVIRRRAGAATS